MNVAVGKPERATQDRVIALFQNELGYRYLGNREYRDGNSNIEEGLLIETEITTLETKLTKLRQLKQGMMHELLTGRIGLI